MNKCLACALVVVMSGCPDIKLDPNETSADPVIEFDPSNSIVPFPNNLLLDRATGKVGIPAGCNEGAATKALREGVLNKLDGFGTFETVMTVTLTAPISPDSVTPDNVLMYKIATGATPVVPAAATAIPVQVIPASTIRYAKQTKNADGSLTCEEPNPIDQLIVVPRIPLEQKSSYVVALTTGLKTTDGLDYVPSFTWALVRQAENPVTVDYKGTADPADDVVVSDRTPLDPTTAAGLASLLGIDLLWNAHAPLLQFLEAKSVGRDDVLLAWGFKTQTTVDGLDPMTTGSPVTQLNDVSVTGPSDLAPVPVSLTVIAGLPGSRAALPFSVCNTGAGPSAPPEANDVQCFLKITLGGGTGCAADATGATCQVVFATGTARCPLFGCANIGDVQTGRILSPQFQLNLPNALDANKPVPGPWGDPVKPTKVEDEQLGALIMIPTGTPPAGGWPTVVFQHGLGQSNTNLFAFGGQAAKDPDGVGTAASGFASIAIDAVAHGSRRVQTSNTAPCDVAPLPSSCFAGFLSPDLGSTRDNIRQTVLDQQQVIASIKKCTGTTCGTFVVDPAHIVYAGISLGGIIGSTTTAISTDLKASVLNVPGVGWADIFENTQTLDIRCTLVDGLIAAGTLVGDPRDTKGTPDESDDTGLCITQAWQTQPGYRQFAAIGRWVLDPSDPANFTTRLAPKKSLIQEVVGDLVVPNIATDNLGALVARSPGAASMNATAPPAAPPPSEAITTNITASKFIRYTNIPPNLPTFPGNTFAHSSLLSPATSVNATTPADQCGAGAAAAFCDGVLGSAQMVVDAVTFLQANK